MQNYVDVNEQSVTIDRNFFFNTFVNPIQNDNQDDKKIEVSALSIRLMAYLMTELSAYHYKKLPSRKTMSTVLGVSPSAIHKCLVALETIGFIIRSVDPVFESMIRCNPDEQKQASEFYKQRNELHKKRGGFSDSFILNVYYNAKPVTTEDLNKLLLQNNFNNIHKYIAPIDEYKLEVVRHFLKNLLADEQSLAKFLDE